MQTKIARRAPRRWVFVGIVLVLLLGVLVWQLQPTSLLGITAPAAPTPCPDTLACHALKRMQSKAGQ